MLESWRGIAALDLHQFYGIDMSQPEAWRQPWAPLRERILGLMDEPRSRLARALAEQQTPQEAPAPA